jgi:Importin-beta N-terminal domain
MLSPMQLLAAEAAPVEVRQAASVNFKNHVKARWKGRPADDLGGGAVAAMPDAEKVGPVQTGDRSVSQAELD